MFNTEDLQKLREEAIKEGLAFGITRLKERYRMKPKKEAEPFSYIKSPHNKRQNPIYLVADCVPMRKKGIRTKPRSKAQLHYDKILAQRQKMKGLRYRESANLAFFCNQRSVVFLDTETTGIEEHDQVVEVAVMTDKGKLIFHKRFSPSTPITNEAKLLHGIDQASVEHCGAWPDHSEALEKALKDRHVVTLNDGFTFRAIQQTAKAYGDIKWLSLSKLGIRGLSLSTYQYINQYLKQQPTYSALQDVKNAYAGMAEFIKYSKDIDQELAKLEKESKKTKKQTCAK